MLYRTMAGHPRHFWAGEKGVDAANFHGGDAVKAKETNLHFAAGFSCLRAIMLNSGSYDTEVTE